MIKRQIHACVLPFFVAALAVSTSLGQSLNKLNFRHLYSPSSPATLSFNLVKNGDSMIVYYKLVANDGPVVRYRLSWSRRSSFEDPSDTPLSLSDSIIETGSSQQIGCVKVPIEPNPWILITHVRDTLFSSHWIYPKIIERPFPVHGSLVYQQTPHIGHFIFPSKPQIQSSTKKPWTVTYYKQTFPPAPLPFTVHSPIDSILYHDSCFVVHPTDVLHLADSGLYLFQTDTLSSEGFSCRVVPEFFPQYSHIRDLAAPLSYLCSDAEKNELEKIGNNKSKFDQFVLNIIGHDKNKARSFIRQYYQRVHDANRMFTSFKVGWKTDRGMIFIIFGPPRQVRITKRSEIWYYTTTRNPTFTFVKKGSVYDPNYFILLRDPNINFAWFEQVKRCRDAQF